MAENKLKDNQTVRPVIDAEGGRVLFHVRGFEEPLVLEMARLHPDVLARAAMVGMAQVRIVDAAAVGRIGADGAVLSNGEMAAEKHRRMAELIAHYHTGTPEWGRKRAEGAGPVAGVTLQAVADVRFSGDVETAGKALDALAQKRGIERAALLRKLAAAADVARRIAEIKAAKAPAGADEMLDELRKE